MIGSRPILALLAVMLGGADAVAAQSTSVTAARDSAARSAKTKPLLAAPYVALPRGTEYEYSTFTNRITRSSGWKSWFVDAHGRPGLHVALFINDDPKQPSKIDERELAKLWPLEIGNVVKTRLERDDGTAEEWQIAVSDTATIKVPLGSVFTYHVRAAQKASVLKRGTSPYANLYEFWYAPAWGAIVRVKFAGAMGPSQGRTQADQIVFIRRPKV